MGEFTWWMTTFGPVVGTGMASLIGFLAWQVLRRILAEIDKVATNTADLPAIRADVKTLGREMGERKAWEANHLDRYHPVHNGQQGD